MEPPTGSGEALQEVLPGEVRMFLDGMRSLRMTMGVDFPLTANTTASLADPEGRCTLESRQKANSFLELLFQTGVLTQAPPHEIAGDRTPAYNLSDTLVV